MTGHWDGDFIMGAGNKSSARVSAKLNSIAAPLRKSFTYDQGKEMSRHVDLAAKTGVKGNGCGGRAHIGAAELEDMIRSRHGPVRVQEGTVELFGLARNLIREAIALDQCDAVENSGEFDVLPSQRLMIRIDLD